jgi:hypothetical protein
MLAVPWGLPDPPRGSGLPSAGGMPGSQVHTYREVAGASLQLEVVRPDSAAGRRLGRWPVGRGRGLDGRRVRRPGPLQPGARARRHAVTCLHGRGGPGLGGRRALPALARVALIAGGPLGILV